MQNIDTREIKAFIKEQGADLVGIAEADCFQTDSRRRGPQYVMPEARSIIVFAQRMLVGCIESPSDMVVTIQGIALYDELHRLAHSAARFLEQRGFRAAIVPPYSPVEMSSETKGFTGEVSLRHAAAAAGLGVLGNNNLVVTPEFGPRVRLGAVVTAAELAPDHPSSEDFCKNCHACISACPVDALSEPGKTRTGRCVRQALPHGLAKVMDYLADTADKSREEMAASFAHPEFWNMYQSVQLGIQYGCHACINACPVGSLNPK
jgi:epoxyqueuosine reductase